MYRYSGKTLDTSLFWQNGIRRNKRAPCVAVWKPVVAATVAAAVVHRGGSAQLPQAVESSCALCHSTGSNSSRTAPSLLARTRGLRNNQRARLVVVVEDVAAVILMGVGVAGLEGSECS